jgi:hypothetical protein
MTAAPFREKDAAVRFSWEMERESRRREKGEGGRERGESIRDKGEG